MSTIRGSVGKKGQNRRADVKCVQQLLNNHLAQLSPRRQQLVVDGLIGPQTIRAIRDFQAQVVGYKKPDSLVSVGGKTLTQLQARPAATSPSPAATPAVSQIPKPTASGWVLGQLSEKYETGNRGPGTVSGGQGDAGGSSYGSYQMTSIPRGGTVTRFITQPDFYWRNDFKELDAGSRAFTTVWKAIASAEPEAFQAAQHAYIKHTHYDILVQRINADCQIHVNRRSRALQDVVWSTAVQHGPRTSVVRKAFAAVTKQGLTARSAGFEKAFIEAIYAERGRKKRNGDLVYFSRNSAAVQRGVARRFVNELKDALTEYAQEKA